MTTDRELLRRYTREKSQDAFTEIVRRHVDLVYGAALRRLCGDASLAKDVTQKVFTALAAKADSPHKITHLSAWLYGTTRFTVSHAVRAERRRQDREHKAQTMETLLSEHGPDEAPEVPPGLLDRVLESLDETDRQAILLRFLEGQSFAAIGAAMGTSEDAARMRVTRALERIRGLFSRSGITSSAAAVGAALANQVVAAPSSLAASVSANAVAATAAIGGAAGAKLGILTLMTTTKAASWIAGAVALAALGYSGYQYREAAMRSEESARLSRERDKLKDELNRSEQRSSELTRQAAQADQRYAALQRRLDGLLAAKTVQVSHGGRAPSNDAQALEAKRMAELKPLLEAGMPIKGAIIVLVDGKPVQRQVQFVMGQETRIEGVDDGTYVVTPTLNDDGSVKYAIGLLRKDTGGVPDPVETLPFVIVGPWKGFSLSTGEGKVMAFDPDSNGP
jgi:RNA polymerase sigma factor (sigma-70 family)